MDQLPEHAFRVRDAEPLGLTAARVRRRDLYRPYRGVRVGSEPQDLVDRCRAYLPLLPETSWFSHQTSAALWGLWLPWGADQSIHVTAPLPHRAPRMRGVVGHKAVAKVTVGRVEGLPVASPIDTWRGLSLVLGLDDLIAAGDSLVRRKDPLAAMHDLSAAVVRGHRGAPRLRAALRAVREGCDSRRETKLRLLLSRGGLPEPEVNGVVATAPRTRYGDLVYRRWRVIVEYDGRHHLTPTQRAHDILRLEELIADGWLIVVVVAEHFAAPSLIVDRVAAALRSRGWHP